MAPWGHRKRSATLEWQNVADRILEGELARQTAGSVTYITPQSIKLPELSKTLDGLRVYSTQAKTTVEVEDLKCLDYNDPVFQCAAATAQFGIDLLSSAAGFQSLAITGSEILEETKDKKQKAVDHEIMTDHAKEFLKKVTGDFPVVVVRDLDTLNARTNKRNPDEYNFHQAVVIEINMALVHKFIEAHQSLRGLTNNERSNGVELSDGLKWERFRTVLFRMGVTFAHELCHVFTNYLVRNPKLHTPPSVSYGPWRNGKVGESGRQWEWLTFGGYVDMRMGSQMERVAIRDENETKVAIFGPQVIAKMLHRDFSGLPFLNPEEWEGEDSIEHLNIFARTSYDWKQKYRDIFAQEEVGQSKDRLGQVELSEEMVGRLLIRREQGPHRIEADNLRSFALDRYAQVAGNSKFSWRVAAAAASQESAYELSQ
ncbi:hypothetical protein E4U43_002753 [Claviceps pusilla]|uniref:Uncharacterized protein n=1 Tax=Claviceps pusilla TaxID=123648 RepID=A0A9P7T3V3_9HYPO|nr:hypothetical protein E4U43_002753 [Claviceps pusilla]